MNQIGQGLAAVALLVALSFFTWLIVTTGMAEAVCGLMVLWFFAILGINSMFGGEGIYVKFRRD